MSARWALSASSSTWIPVNKTTVIICIVKYKFTYFLPFRPFFFLFFSWVPLVLPVLGRLLAVSSTLEAWRLRVGGEWLLRVRGGMMVSGDGGDNSGDGGR